MIYAVQGPDGDDPVRIGSTQDVAKRVAQLAAHLGHPLTVLMACQGDRAVERAIREKFAHLRIGSTEDFRATPDLLAFLARPVLEPDELPVAGRGRPTYAVMPALAADRDLDDAMFRLFVVLRTFDWDGDGPLPALNDLAGACGWFGLQGWPDVPKLRHNLAALEEREYIRVHPPGAGRSMVEVLRD